MTLIKVNQNKSLQSEGPWMNEDPCLKIIEEQVSNSAHVAERSKAADSRSAGRNPARVRISPCALFLHFAASP